MKKTAILALACVAVLMIGVSTYKLGRIKRDYAEGEDCYDSVADRFAGELGPADETVAGPDDLEPPPSVDFEALRRMNGDIVAWLYCPGTVVNYPVAQGEDNERYLRVLPDGKRNNAGTLFLHYKNDPRFEDLNSVVYGHNMKNDSMFGTLVKYKKQEYYDERPAFWLLTPDRNYKLDLVAGYVTAATDDAYDFFETKERLADFVNAAIKKSTFKSGFDVSNLSRVVTLSTCSYEFDGARYVLIANSTPLPPSRRREIP